MNLKNKTLFENLKAINDESMRYFNKSKTELLNMFIEEKLQNTLYKYNIKLEELSTYLGKQGGIRVLKALAKIRKQDDKAIIEQNMIK